MVSNGKLKLLTIRKKTKQFDATAIVPVGVAADGERLIQESIYSGDLADN